MRSYCRDIQHMKHYIFTFFFSLLFLNSVEKRPTPEAYTMLEQAKKQMEAGNYPQANLIFRKMLQLKSVLPTEMSYLFAETLYKVGQYENSMNFLKRYQNITDRGSDYYLLSLALEKELKEKLQEIKDCPFCDQNGYKLSPCLVCNTTAHTIQTCNLCRGKGLITCPACTGSGVIISSSGQFNTKEYRSCERCQSKGYITCYVCDGKKEITAFCTACDGKGYQATNQLCDHTGL